LDGSEENVAEKRGDGPWSERGGDVEYAGTYCWPGIVVTGSASRDICDGAVVYMGMVGAPENSDIVTGGDGDEVE